MCIILTFDSIDSSLQIKGDTYEYKYEAVSRWSRLVPGANIFELDKIIVPVNQDGQHWGCAVIFMQEKRIQFYDSMHKNGEDYVNALFQYLKDEWVTSYDTEPFPNENEWRLIPNETVTPTQHNG